MTLTARSTERAARMDHAGWMRAAAEEYRRLDGLLRELSPHEWALPTDCAGWDVHSVVAHLAGAAQSTASVREMLRQQRLGRKARPGAPDVDGMNDVQVEERAGRTPEQLVAELAEAGARGVRRRERLPVALRAVRVPFGPPLGFRSVGYLMDRIYTRDAWMHRVDICRATGRSMALTADHDRRLVADVVVEWAQAHGQPFRLVLTGPAGGSWSAGEGGAAHDLDAVEFCRIVSGRSSGGGLLATPVPF